MKVKIKSDTAVDCLFTNLISPYDIRDYRLVATAREFPETFTLPTVTVKHQGRTGSCVAHACSSVVEYHNKRQEGTDVVFSTEFIYGYRPQGYYVGEGMYVREALETLRTLGDCPREDLKGNNKCPEAMAAVEARLEELKEKAYPHRISTYAKINTIDETKQALMDFGYVVITMPWYKDYKLTKKGVYSTTAKDKQGYHCMVIYGWNKEGWLVHNSWGELWGEEGRFIVPFDVELVEIWAVTDAIKSKEDIVKPADNWFVKTFAPVINAIVNFFRSFFKK